jgi:heptosyltransferase III
MGISRQSKSIRVANPAPRNVLVLRSGGLGDFILALPVLTLIRRAYPQAVIELVGHPEIGELGLDRYYLNRIASIHEARFARLFAAEALDDSDPLVEYLSSFGLAISFLGERASSLGDRLGSLIDRLIFVPRPLAGAGHACTQFLGSLRDLVPQPDFARIESLPPRVFLSATDRLQGRKILMRTTRQPGLEPVIAIHPGSGSPRKNWAPRHFAAVAACFQDHGSQVILVQGEADEMAVQEVLAAAPSREFRILKGLRVIEVAQALAACRLLIGNDSGISHLAAAVGIPVLAVFGATDPAVWRPLGSRVTVLAGGEATPQMVVKAGRALL